MGQFAIAIRAVINRIKTLEAELASVKAELAEMAAKGEWSLPMSKKEMAALLGLRIRAFNTFAKSHRLRKVSRQQFQMLLDGMDSRTRRLIERQGK